jgi:hypothetical protein
MKTFLLPLGVVLSMTVVVLARGGGGEFHGGMGGGEFRDAAVEDGAWRDEARPVDDNLSRDDAALRDDPAVRNEAEDIADNDRRVVDNAGYDPAVIGPEGYRTGYIWRNGDYVAVNCDPFVPYAAPFGVWAGWNIVTQPEYVDYPVYASYPIETAVELALQKLGLYSGPIDGRAASCAGAIEQYQTNNGMTVTGTISPELLTALGIQASYQ